MAQALGLHVHSPSSSIRPFELEMRRRLWNQICVLDINSSIDRGTEPIITDRFTSALAPININDTDFFPDIDTLPPPRDDFTDESFSLMGNVEKAFIRSLVTVPRGGIADDLAQMSWQKKQQGTFFKVGTGRDHMASNLRLTVHVGLDADLEISSSRGWISDIGPE